MYSVDMTSKYTRLILVLFASACTDPCWKLCRQADKCFEVQFEAEYDDGRSDCRDECEAEISNAYYTSDDCGDSTDAYYFCVGEKLCNQVYDCQDRLEDVVESCRQVN